jgi:RNA polymerase sigma factor (sigma-70 family)
MTALDRHTQRGARENACRCRVNASQRKDAPWDHRCERWGLLMTAAQRGVTEAYDRLIRELDPWLRRYYERRLPPCAAEDARQDALLALHVSLHSYRPSKPFGPWVATIARNKWIDHVRQASRHQDVALDDGIPVTDCEEPLMATRSIDRLIGQLKPAQASVIRLVKLQGISVRDASALTGQTSAVVKVNIHRGLKKLAVLATDQESASPRERSFDDFRARKQSGTRLAHANKIS